MIYKRDIGRYEQFPVSMVKLTRLNGWWARFRDRHATVELVDGSSYQFTHAEYDVLLQRIQRWDDIKAVSGIIAEHKTAIQNR